MKKTFRRIVSLALALIMALSLAVSASAAEQTFDLLTDYGNTPTTISSESIIPLAENSHVVNYNSVKTYVCEAPVTVTSAAQNYCRVIELDTNVASHMPYEFTDNCWSVDGSYTITAPGTYLLLDEPLNPAPIKLVAVLQVEAGGSPEEEDDAITGGIIEPGLHNFYRVNTYTVGQYKDVPATHTFSDNVKAGFEFGIMQGYGTTFGVGNSITRLASIIIACRLNSFYEVGGNYIEINYTGTTKEMYMAYAKENGILCDFDDVSKPATRAEFAAILSSAFPDEALTAINTVADNAIPDVTTDMKYADSIYRLYRAGILNGSDSIGTFYPTSNINRGAACAIATRMCDEALRKSVSMESNYASLLDEAILNVADEYLVAAASISACAETIQMAAETGTFTLNSTAYSYYLEVAASLERAVKLCGSHAALKTVKSDTSNAIRALTAAIPTQYNVNSPAFSEAMLIGLQTALVHIQYGAVELDKLLA